MSIASQLFSELGNDARMKILHTLLQKSMKTTEITKILKMSIPGTQKHLVKLFSLDLIQKNPDSSLSLTEKGRIVLDLISNFDFIYEKPEILKNHTLSFLPSKFVKRLGDLQNCKVTKGYVNNIEIYKDIILNSMQYVKHCTNTIPIDTYKIAIPHFKKHNVNMSFILAKEMNLPSGWKEIQEKLGEEELVQKGLMQRHMIDKLNVIMWVSENMCSLILPRLDGSMELETMLVSTDSSFREWCSDYFDYLWEHSNSFVQNYVSENIV